MAAHQREVQALLTAAVDALGDLYECAHRGAYEDFIDDLESCLAMLIPWKEETP